VLKRGSVCWIERRVDVSSGLLASSLAVRPVPAKCGMCSREGMKRTYLNKAATVCGSRRAACRPR